MLKRKVMKLLYSVDRMKYILRFALAATLFSLGNMTYAGTCDNCVIESIATGPNYERGCTTGSCAFIRINSTGGTFSRYQCSTSPNWHFVLDTSTSSGKNSLSMLLTAFTTGKKVVIYGDNKCNI